MRPISHVLLNITNPKSNKTHKVHFILVADTLQCLLGSEIVQRLSLINVNHRNFIANVTTTGRSENTGNQNNIVHNIDNFNTGSELGDLGVAKLRVDPTIPPKVLPCTRKPFSRQDREIKKIKNHDSGADYENGC